MTLAQAKAKAKESMKKKNVISTISRIAYFNSENNKKQCLGLVNIQTVINDLKNEDPELSHDYQIEFDIFKKAKKEDLILHDDYQIKLTNHRKNRKEENKKAQTIINNVIEMELDPNQIIIEIDVDTDQEMKLLDYESIWIHNPYENKIKIISAEKQPVKNNQTMIIPELFGSEFNATYVNDQIDLDFPEINSSQANEIV